MLVYIINLLLVYFLTLVARGYTAKNNGTLTPTIRTNKLLFYVAVISMVLVAGLRDRTGTDFSTYRTVFILQSDDRIIDILTSKEGFFWGIARIVHIFTDNTSVSFFIFALLIIFLITKTIYNYSTILELSMFLYIATMDYYSSFNGIRQWVAAAILFYASKYIYQGKFFNYLLLVLIATCFHNSAIIMLPIYFLVRSKPWSRTIWVTVIFSILITLLFPNFTNFVLNTLEGNESYQKYLNLDPNDDGVHPLRVLVAAVPVLLSVIGYKLMNTSKKIEIDVWINFSLLNLVTLLIATQNTFIARICFYFSLYNVLLIPLILNIFNKESKRILYFLIIVLYFIYMIFLLPNESDLLPYRNIFGQIFQ